MTSRADGVQKRIADLSELIVAAQNDLAAFGEGGHPHANVRAANLQATIKTVQRGLARA